MTNEIDGGVSRAEFEAAGSNAFDDLFARSAGVAALPAAAPQAVTPSVVRSHIPGVQGLTVERHPRPSKKRSWRALDWAALASAIVVPPLGIAVSAAAVIVGSVRNGWAAGVAKSALAISLVLSAVLAAGGVVLIDALDKQAAHDAVVRSSVAMCSRVEGKPGLISSSTFGWPATGDSVADSVAPMQQYSDFWSRTAHVAPTAIRPGVQSIATAAKGIASSVASSHVLDDAANVTQMQQVVASSGVADWVAEYCNG